MTAIYDPDRLRSALKGRRFGTALEIHRRIGSTNDRALELLEKGFPEGTLVVAEEQTRGRGRRERTWVSPPRLGLYASLLLRPSFPPPTWPLAGFAAAVGAARGIEEAAGCAIRIKWPNDLFLRGRKLGGILAEGRGEGGAPGIAVGIGVNVNHLETDFPDAIRPGATSLRIASGREGDLQEILVAILGRWEEEHDRLASRGPGAAIERWRRFDAFEPSTPLRVDLEGSTIFGRYRGVGPGGELRLEEEGGRILPVTFGDARRVREEEA